MFRKVRHQTFWFLFIGIVSMVGPLFSQKNLEPCGSVEYHSRLIQKYPDLIPSQDSFERWMAEKIQHSPASFSRSGEEGIRTIPVIFHIFHDIGQDIGSGSNITYDQVKSQIEVLNEDFRRLGAGYNQHPDGADSKIEFCLALFDENGNVLDEPGILRWSNWGNGPFQQNTFDNNIKPNTSQDPSRFLNFWAADMYSQGLIGYAQFPNSSGLPDLGNNYGPSSQDGVVIITSAVGRTGTAASSIWKGRAATHEIGHWLGLRHTWGGGSCSSDDYCNDTPLCSSYYYSEYPNCEAPYQCGAYRMVENYLDYSDGGCMSIFTNDQKMRMDVVLNNSPNRPFSYDVPTECYPGKMANIIHEPGSMRSCGATQIHFINQPEYQPNSQLWTFQGANPNFSSTGIAAPYITFLSSGTAQVHLTTYFSSLIEYDSTEISIIILPQSDSLCMNPSCFDGIKNGDETGIDCGGSCPETCVTDCAKVQVLNGLIQLTEDMHASHYIESGELTGDGEAIVFPGNQVVFSAVDSILLKPGFRVDSNAVFEILMTGCGN